MNFSQHGVVTELVPCPQCEQVGRDEISYFQADYLGIKLRHFQCIYGHLHFTQLPDQHTTPERIAA